ncbi:MBL fold metallo-hydrolase [Candidatus Kaiserbacteria bacterium]|nr:MBL fold metallo-hydrolase [Candidatus Kaiserbacteria bacterium]
MTILVLLVAFIAIVCFVKFAPQFGKPPQGDHLELIKQSPQYQVDRFENNPKISLDFSLADAWSAFWESITGDQKRRPSSKLPASPLSVDGGGGNHLTWFGHSTFLYEVDDKKVLFDPMLGKYASPLPGIIKRYDYDLPSSAKDLPSLDLVIISHDHYDHLDYGTIKDIEPKTKLFLAPLGVGSHLKLWGVPEEKIIELDWWQEFSLDGLMIVAVPSQHFSGRSVNDAQKTLWAAWVVKTAEANVFFGGDSGYFSGFADIGNKYGPFDLTLLDSGQYHDSWSAVHMTPEESVKAHAELKGKKYMPMHWAAFTLSLHSWTEPAERALKAVEATDITAITPVIGERFDVLKDVPNEKWWEDVD